MTTRHDRFWADYFGIDAVELTRPGHAVIPHHVALSDYPGVWFFRRGARLVVSAPPAWVPHIARFLDHGPDPTRLPDLDTLTAIFGSSVTRTIGPTFHGAIESSMFRAASSDHVRALTDADADGISELRDRCAAEEWEYATIEKAHALRHAAFHDGRIVAVAGFRPWSGAAGDPCVITDPDHRGRGHATAVVSGVVAAALARDHVLLYQTLDENVASVRIALTLGYVRYATRIAVRLGTDEPPT